VTHPVHVTCLAFFHYPSFPWIHSISIGAMLYISYSHYLHILFNVISPFFSPWSSSFPYTFHYTSHLFRLSFTHFTLSAHCNTRISFISLFLILYLQSSFISYKFFFSNPPPQQSLSRYRPPPAYVHQPKSPARYR
jgi:hypothetical protein